MSGQRSRPPPPGEEEETGRLTAAAATCPVCLSILLEPVTMPCRHTLCMPCFDATVEQAALSCPLCRQRISVWLRRTRRAGRLVDERLWARLQRDFPQKVQARREGREADFSEEDVEPALQHLSAPGEIRREFELQLEAARSEDEERRSRSERASRELIDRLEQETAEQARQRQEQEQRDAELARGVMREEELLITPSRPVGLPGQQRTARQQDRRPVSTPVRGPMDVYVGQLTPCVGAKRPVSPVWASNAAAAAAATATAQTPPSPTGSGKENSDPAEFGAGLGSSGHSPDSADSICTELRHFKPIRAAPTTPPRRRPDGVLGAPPVVHAVARVLDRPWRGGTAQTRCPADGRAPGSQELRDRHGQSDAAEDGPSGSRGAEETAGKRPAERPPLEDRPAKRRPPPRDESVERELPLLVPPREQEQELDLGSAELLQEQLEAERLLQLELADRRLAEQLQRELNTVPPVDRSKGSADAYSLRGASSRGQKRSAASRRGSAPATRGRAQLSIQQSLDRCRARRTGR